MKRKLKSTIVLSIVLFTVGAACFSIVNNSKINCLVSTNDYTNSLTITPDDIQYAVLHDNQMTKNGITFSLTNVISENSKILFHGLEGSTELGESSLSIDSLSLPVTGQVSGNGYLSASVTNIGGLSKDDYGKLGICSFGGTNGTSYIGYKQFLPVVTGTQTIAVPTNDTYTSASKIRFAGKTGYNITADSISFTWSCKYVAPVVPPEDKNIYISSPEDKEVVDILQSGMRNYINDFYAKAALKENDYLIDINEVNTTDHTPRVKDYKDGSRQTDGKPVTISFYSSASAGTSFIVSYSVSSDLSNPISIETTDDYVSIYNLLSNTTYYYQIVSKDSIYVSPIQSFTTTDGYRMIKPSNVTNIRDIGGKMTKSGKKIKQGLVYRGPEINKEQYTDSNSQIHYKTLDDYNSDLIINKLGIKLEMDFRSAAELRDPTNLVSDIGIEYWSSCSYSSSGWTPAYSYICKNTYNLSMYKNIFEQFLTVDTKPIYMHCAGGFDRTGTVSFILEGLLGVSFTDACIDYEISSLGADDRFRDVDYSSKDGFKSMITNMYNNTSKTDVFPGFDPDETHDLQTICTNILLKAGLTQSQLDTIKTVMLED